MLKNKEEVEVSKIMSFCEDMLRHLKNEIEEEFETNQYHVRMTELFRGHIVVDWKEANFKCKKHKKLNKILVLHCAKFYNKCQKGRNEVLHDEQKQKEQMHRWFEKEKSKADQNEHRQIKLYAD